MRSRSWKDKPLTPNKFISMVQEASSSQNTGPINPQRRLERKPSKFLSILFGSESGSGGGEEGRQSENLKGNLLQRAASTLNFKKSNFMSHKKTSSSASASLAGITAESASTIAKLATSNDGNAAGRNLDKYKVTTSDLVAIDDEVTEDTDDTIASIDDPALFSSSSFNATTAITPASSSSYTTWVKREKNILKDSGTVMDTR